MPVTSFRQNVVLFFFPESIFPHFDNTFPSASFWPWGTHFLGAKTQEEKILEHGWDVRGFTPAPPQGCS